MALGFVSILLLMALLTNHAMDRVEELNDQLQRVVKQYNHKGALLKTMHRAARIGGQDHRGIQRFGQFQKRVFGPPHTAARKDHHPFGIVQRGRHAAHPSKRQGHRDPARNRGRQGGASGQLFQPL